MFDFCGILAEMVTPFQHYEIDFAATKRLAKRQQQSGVAGIVVCSATGEGVALSEGDQMDVIDTVIQAVPGLPVVAALTGTSFECLHGQLLRFNTRPLAGVMVSANCYTRPSQNGLCNLFRTIADDSKHPIIISNVPHHMGVALDLDSVLNLSPHPNIAAIKDSGENASTTTRLIASRQLKVLAGDDGLILSTLCLGGAGAISAAANVLPEVFVDMYRDLKGGSLDRAEMKFESLQPLMALLRSEAAPAAMKTSLAVMGLMQDEVRFPLIRGSGRLRMALREELQRIKLLRQVVPA